MNAQEVYAKLLAEGCNENNFSLGHKGNDCYCLDQQDGLWVVFYTERGQASEPEFKSNVEHDACVFFYDLVMQQPHNHLVGFFDNEPAAIALESKLKSLGIASIRNDMPYFSGSWRYRVFVVGKDIFKTRDALGDIKIDYR